MGLIRTHHLWRIRTGVCKRNLCFPSDSLHISANCLECLELAIGRLSSAHRSWVSSSQNFETSDSAVVVTENTVPKPAQNIVRGWNFVPYGFHASSNVPKYNPSWLLPPAELSSRVRHLKWSYVSAFLKGVSNECKRFFHSASGWWSCLRLSLHSFRSTTGGS